MAKCSRLVKMLVWVALGMGVAVALGWWLARLLREEEETEEAIWTPPQRPTEVEIPLPLPDEEDEQVPVLLEEDASDTDDAEGPADFTRIDGIGPKYAHGLIASGVTSFQQLSEQDPERLAEALRAHGLRVIGDRILQDDWIGQARRLIAEG